jgi:hypothetical protein
VNYSHATDTPTPIGELEDKRLDYEDLRLWEEFVSTRQKNHIYN